MKKRVKNKNSFYFLGIAVFTVLVIIGFVLVSFSNKESESKSIFQKSLENIKNSYLRITGKVSDCIEVCIDDKGCEGIRQCGAVGCYASDCRGSGDSEGGGSPPGGGDSCVPNCEGKSCGDDNGCGGRCPGRCKKVNEACGPERICVKAKGCKDSDAAAYDPHYVKGTTIGKGASGKRITSTDQCKDEKRLSEKVCTADGTIGTYQYTCPFGCQNSACQGCENDKHCPKGKECNEKTNKCEVGCMDSDKDLNYTDKYKDGDTYYKNPFIKGTAIDKDGKKWTDIYYAKQTDKPAYVFEYYCKPDKTVGGERIDCEYEGKNGACSSTCKPSKTCKNYPKQCGPLLNDGCKFSLDCSNNCPKGQYCDRRTYKCTNLIPQNCCIGVWWLDKEHGGTIDDDPCYKLNQEDCAKNSKCSWIVPLPPAQPMCGNRFVFEVDKQMKAEELSKCQDSIILPHTGAVYENTEKFLNERNCRTLRIFLRRHGSAEDCPYLYDYINACYSCQAGNCAYYGVKDGGCSVFNDKSEVEKKALILWLKLKSNNDKTTIFSITANQAVSSLCKPTTQTVSISFNNIRNSYISCDEIREYKYCFGSVSEQAQEEEIICVEPSTGEEKTVMCCNINEPLLFWDFYSWKWTFVDSESPQCPAPEGG